MLTIEMLERALHIHQVLTGLVLAGGNFQQLAVTLADLIGHSISIETETFEALASHNIAPVDEARRYTQSEGKTNPTLIAALESNGTLAEIRRTLKPKRLPQLPDLGLEMERILAPIVVHGGIYGYLWIIADDRPLNKLDEVAIESGATVAALMRLHQEMVANAEASVKGGLLAQLIEGDRDRMDSLTDQALRYGVDLNAPFVVVRIDRADGGAHRLTFQREIARALADARAVIGEFAGEVVALMNRTSAIDAQLASMHAAIDGLRLGVSASVRGAGAVGAAYRQSRDALHIAAKVGIDDHPTILFERLGYLHTLYQAGEGALHANPFVPMLRLLRVELQADLFHTLEVYLDAGANGVQTAEELMIHRSTLNYRLQRIAEVCAVNLGDPVTRTNLQVAIKLVRLFE
ncbi:MAG: helix-turn-helix domain-containing protein [Chloroflexota bacterium]|nr:helix-turn-helix domain-containing protein [Chloroflexota bacterium]